jgi:vitamin B12 transporter
LAQAFACVLKGLQAMNRLQISLIALLAILPAQAMAQTTVTDLDDIVVTANRAPSELSRTGVSVTALSETDLKASATVAESLSRLPGVSIASQGPFGNPANLRVRGADGRYLAVYVDGVRVDDPTGTEVKYDFGSLMTSGVGRIELLRGSQSALWGGSAVGGVINITTRGAMEDGFHQTAEVEAGSYATARLGYGLTFKTDRLELALNASHLRTDGFSAAADGTEADGAEASRLSFSARYAVSDAVTVGASAFTQKTRQEYDGYDPTFTLGDLPNVRNQTEAGGRVFAEVETGATKHTLGLTNFHSDRRPSDENGTSRFDGKRVALSYQGETEVSSALSLIYGADWTRETASYDNLPGGKANTEISGAFAQALWAPTEQIDVSATLRGDNNSTFGTFTTGRLAVAWRPVDGTTVRAALANGFRAPSLDERFGDYPSQEFIGNAALKPEESLSYELGIEQEVGAGIVVSATAFQIDVANLVAYSACPAKDPTNFDFSCVAGTINTLNNVSGTSVRQGLELAANFEMGESLSADVSYTFTQARRQTGERLGLVPKHNFTVTITDDITERLNANLSVNRVIDRMDDFATAAMPNYTVIDVGAAYEISETSQAYLRVENVLDEDYQASKGYGTPGRSIYVGLRAKF